jgi:hypothetical protein
LTCANASAQCAFNEELRFDPDLFPNLPTGLDGNNYKGEAEALAAVKRSLFGPAGTYAERPTRQICLGALISADVYFVKGGVAGEIIFSAVGSVPLASFAGKSILVYNELAGRCTGSDIGNSWQVVSTRRDIYTRGLLLECTSAPAPTLTFTIRGSREIRPAGTGGNSTTEVVTKVADETSPKAGVAVQFTAEVADKSGGHDHSDASRPKGKLSLAQGTTDANGEVKLTFTAPEIAGVHTIKATCADCTNSPASQEIQVKVPDLVNIFAFPVTTLDPKWASPGVGARTNEHTDQHYLTAAATVRLVDISRKYLKIWPTAPKLTLNDASLIWGGKYDLSLTWERNTKRHAEHRVGENIDVRANTAPGAVPSNIRDAVFRWLRKASRPEDNIPAEFVIDSVNPLWENPGDANEHFHLRLGN